ncbi:MAG TPA: hypothetical protein VJN96_16115 [Vicinamibacterales bacterium]|nr:hypothetical protein [Vicinamibacterales bacterium]
MRRLLLIASVVVVATGVMATTFASATWVLTNGQRVSGNINVHTDAKINIARAQFAVGMSDGTEREVPVDQVASIEFVGGDPPMTELEKLPASGHMLAMRDGSTLNGRLTNLINGEFVRWLHAGGSSEDIPIRNISRVYMNTESARRIYHYVPPAAAPAAATPTPAPGSLAVPDGPGVIVRADIPWNDTGITVNRNEKVRFKPSGQIRWGANADMLAGPSGSILIKNPGFPVPAMNVGALIGRVATSRAFYIGIGEVPITMPAAGRLLLGVNDNELQDNAGAFRVEILRNQ